MLESTVETEFVRRLENAGLMHRKLNGAGRAGWPDRLVVLPRGYVVFVELKAPGKKIGKRRGEKLQLHTHNMLRDRNHLVLVGDDASELWAKIEKLLQAIDRMPRRKVSP